jgi:hypothetical protein
MTPGEAAVSPGGAGAGIARLQRLRARFLEGGCGDYWTDAEDLRLYDEFFARRIEWKWAGMWEQIEELSWHPQSTVVLDWGCGSGRISRFVAQAIPCRKIYLHDRSRLSVEFALARLAEAGVEATAGLPPEPGFLLLVSHVLNELPAAGREELLEQARKANEILWVEAGDRKTSLELSRMRDCLIGEGFAMMGPCTQQKPCPMLRQGGDTHWCHFFAKPPSAVFQSGPWNEFSRGLGIDLRALPFSYLAATRDSSRLGEGVKCRGSLRSIGAPLLQKGFADVLACGGNGLQTIRLKKRDDPARLRRLKKDRRSFLLSAES